MPFTPDGVRSGGRTQKALEPRLESLWVWPVPLPSWQGYRVPMEPLKAGSQHRAVDLTQ